MQKQSIALFVELFLNTWFLEKSFFPGDFGVARLIQNYRNSEKVFVSQERVSGFPEKGADSGEVRELLAEVWGTSGEVRETSGKPLDYSLVPQ